MKNKMIHNRAVEQNRDKIFYKKKKIKELNGHVMWRKST